MLMHLKFCFESIPTKQSPGAILKYYRLRKGFTTRQLAETIGIVPATILNYEQEKNPIPYQTALNIANALEIETTLLFDDFAGFLDSPYNIKLQSVRKSLKLSQAAFAEQIGVSLSIYCKWEAGTRQPSRKMYQRLAEFYPEIKA